MMIQIVLSAVFLLKIHGSSYYNVREEYAVDFDNDPSLFLADADNMLVDDVDSGVESSHISLKMNDNNNQEQENVHFKNDNNGITGASLPPGRSTGAEKDGIAKDHYLVSTNATTTLQVASTRLHDNDRQGHDATTPNSTITNRSLKFAFITFSHLSNASQFESTVLEAVNTWVPSDSKYFVVLNQKWQEVFDQWKEQKQQQQQQQGQKMLEGVVNRIQPIYVDCPEARSGESPCCKQQKGLVEFDKTYNVDKSFDWIVYMDDDVYLQPNVLEAYIKTLPIIMPDLNKYVRENGDPMLIAASIPFRLGRAGYLRGPSAGYRCSRDEDFQYPWGQPAIYNQAALQLVIPGLQLNGLVQQCLEYNVTHDVGNAIFHWMYSIPSTRIRSVNFKGKKPQWGFRGDTIVYHGAGSSPEIPMKMFHERRTKDIEVPFTAPKQYFGRFNPNGFQRTETFKKFGSPSEWKVWHTMPISDCNA
jgi:hypothetical protein